MRRLGTLVGALLWLSGCPGTEERIAQGVLAEGCILNSECQTPLVCAFRRCHAQCETNDDCVIAGERLSCVPSDRPYKVCLLQSESRCVYNTDCPLGLRCARDLRCRLDCVADVDCVTGQVCSQGACAAPNELVGGQLPNANDGGVPQGAVPCTYTSQCEVPFVCLSGACRPQCSSARDCFAGESCEAGSCQRADAGVVDAGAGDAGTPGDGGLPGWGMSCLLNSDCPTPLLCGPRNACAYECVEARDCEAGACCYLNRCRRGAICIGELPDGGLVDGGVRDAGASYCLNDLACDDGNFCNGIELCRFNVCQPASHGICEDFNPCSIDMCDATSRRCSYASGGVDAGDVDNDGHTSILCGGGADDCDDTNPNVYPGHPEDCDFVDNNCDGQVDEGLWREKAGARISLHGQARFPFWAGPPSVVAIDGGFIIAASSDTIDGKLELVRTDRNLTLQQGPVPLFGSSTAWVTPFQATVPHGRRLILPKLIAANGRLLATAFVASAGGATGCPSGGPWQLELPVVEFNTQLAQVRQWESVANGPGQPCNSPTPTERYFPDFGAAQPFWSPGVGRWLVSWGAALSIAPRQLQAATFDADGGLTARHSLLTPATEAQQQILDDQHVVEAPQVVAAADRVLVAWNQSGNYPTRFVLMDPALNSALGPPQDLLQATARLVSASLSEDGQRFVLVTSTNSTLPTIRELTLDGGVAAGPWVIPHGASPVMTAVNGNGLVSAFFTDVKPFNDGYLATAPSWPNQNFSYLSRKNDGGAVTTQLAFSTAPRSQLVLVPIDDVTVGLVWTDGELKRTLMECRP